MAAAVASVESRELVHANTGDARWVWPRNRVACPHPGQRIGDKKGGVDVRALAPRRERERVVATRDLRVLGCKLRFGRFYAVLAQSRSDPPHAGRAGCVSGALCDGRVCVWGRTAPHTPPRGANGN